MTILIALLLATGPSARQHQHPSGGMDFDQAATVHHFLLARDGGSIAIEVRDPQNLELRDMVRMHLSALPAEFAAGNFEKPFATHGETPAGVPEMIRLKAALTYTFEESKDGGRVRIRAASPEALDAVHTFLRYQIREHRTGDPLTVGK